MCHEKHTISNGNPAFSCFPFHVSVFSSPLTPLLSCYFVFEHVSGTCPLLWLELLLCLDSSGIVLLWLQQHALVHSAVVVKVSLLRLWFLLLVIRTKRDWGGVQPTRSDCGRTRLQPACHAVCGRGRACLSKHLSAKLQCAVWFGGDGQLSLWSSTYLGGRCCFYMNLMSSVPSQKKKHKKSDTKSEEKLPSFKVEQIYSLLLGFVLNKKGKALISMFNL